MAIYVVSDIHGCYNLFLKGLSEISFSENDYLWCLGDAIDRGPDGVRILQYIMSHDNMDLIIGNHELMMLNSVNPHGKDICDGNETYLWLEVNGGKSTYDQYGKLIEEERLKLLEWLRSRYVIRTLNVEGHLFCLTHSYYNPKYENMRCIDLPYGDAWSITWSSIWRKDVFTHALDIYGKYDHTFICGHVPVQKIGEITDSAEKQEIKSFKHGNLVNIDGGCALDSKLTRKGMIILKLNDMSEYVTYGK